LSCAYHLVWSWEPRHQKQTAPADTTTAAVIAVRFWPTVYCSEPKPRKRTVPKSPQVFAFYMFMDRASGDLLQIIYRMGTLSAYIDLSDIAAKGLLLPEPVIVQCHIAAAASRTRRPRPSATVYVRAPVTIAHYHFRWTLLRPR